MITTTANVTLVRATAAAAVVGLVAIALFQLALALGAPLGHAAWGGTHSGSLPRGLRIASALAVVVWAGAAMLVIRRAGFGMLAMPEAVARWGTWILFGLLLLGAVMNVASSSTWERYFWGPYALILAGLCCAVARSDGT